MFRPQGRELTPHGVMGIVTGDEEPHGAVYRHADGRVYFLGLREDRLLWKERGYEFMGTIPFIRARFRAAGRDGIREHSMAWYLLTDAERQTQHDWRQAEE